MHEGLLYNYWPLASQMVETVSHFRISFTCCYNNIALRHAIAETYFDPIVDVSTGVATLNCVVLGYKTNAPCRTVHYAGAARFLRRVADDKIPQASQASHRVE